MLPKDQTSPFMERTTRFLSNILMLTALMLLGACTSDNERQSVKSARIIPQLTVAADVTIAEDVNNSMAIDTVPPADDFVLVLVDKNSGRSHTWERAADFPTGDFFLTGSYSLTAYHGDPLTEGFDAAFYFGETAIELSESAIARPKLDCRLYNTMVDIGFSPQVFEWFDSLTVLLHSSDGSYLRYPMTESRPIFMHPGELSIFLDITDRNGRKAIISCGSIDNALIGYYYHLQVSTRGTSSEPELILSFSEKIETDDIHIPLTSEFFNAEPPAVTYTGFTPGQLMTLPEGSIPDTPVTFTVSSPTLESVQATWVSIENYIDNLPTEADLMHLNTWEIDSLRSMGVDISITDTSLHVDFSNLLPRLRRRPSPESSKYTFTIVGRDAQNHISSPLVFEFEPSATEIIVTEAHAVKAGSSRASIKIASASSPIIPANVTVDIFSAAKGSWEPASGLSVTLTDSGEATVEFDVDPDSTADIEVRFSYCNAPFSTLRLTRVSPQYTVEADAFAHKAILHIIPFDPDDMDYIVRHVMVYAGGRRYPVAERDPATGMITVTGLNESTHYDLRLTVIDTPDQNDFALPVIITTERAVPLRNGDFEEIDTQIDVKGMDCGGRYSQSYVPIFNQQNSVTFNVSAPKNWANTNAKTFSNAGGVRNTWYMQPSCETTTAEEPGAVSSGAYAVRLTTVAWDSEGSPVPDYLQESQPFVPFSRNVPKIRYRAVGKLFLGEYQFDPITLTERYTTSVPMQSRPASLNGFYRFTPGEDMPGDAGMAQIEVYGLIDGVEQLIASTVMELQPVTSYTAFAVPLTYAHFGVKATRIAVMLASSVHTGNIRQETSDNITTDDLPNACSIGSRLWIDNLSLSY